MPRPRPHPTILLRIPINKVSPKPVPTRSAVLSIRPAPIRPVVVVAAAAAVVAVVAVVAVKVAAHLLTQRPIASTCRRPFSQTLHHPDHFNLAPAELHAGTE